MVRGAAEDEALGFEGLVGDGEGFGGDLIELARLGRRLTDLKRGGLTSRGGGLADRASGLVGK